MASDLIHVTRHDWLYGLVNCPSCGLPLDKDRDNERDFRAERACVDGSAPAAIAGVEGTHRRCGVRFLLTWTR